MDYLTLSVILFSFVLGEIIALRFRIPPLIVFLVIGALVGTYGFVQQSDTLSFLGELGSILLLFAIGTEFSIGRLIHDGFGRAGAIAIIEIVIAMGLLYFAFLLWFSQPVAIILALAFSITSTGTTVKLIKSLELGKKFNISQMIQISIIEDLVAVFAFSVINSFAIIRSPKPEEVAVSFLVSLVLFVIAYYVFTRLLNRIIYRYRIVGEDMLMLALAAVAAVCPDSDASQSVSRVWCLHSGKHSQRMEKQERDTGGRYGLFLLCHRPFGEPLCNRLCALASGAALGGGRKVRKLVWMGIGSTEEREKAFFHGCGDALYRRALSCDSERGGRVLDNAGKLPRIVVLCGILLSNNIVCDGDKHRPHLSRDIACAGKAELAVRCLCAFTLCP